MSTREVYVPLSEYLPTEVWPAHLFATEDGSFLDLLAYDDGEIAIEEERVSARVALRVMIEIAFELPAGFALVLGKGPVAASLEADSDGFFVQVSTDVVKLRLPRSLFVPVLDLEGNLEPDPDPAHFVEVALPLGITVDHEGNIDLEWPGETPGRLALPRCMIGDSGVIVSAENIGLRLSGNQPLPEGAAAAGLDDAWRGAYLGEAAILLPPGLGSAVPSDLRFHDAFIGNGGFSGAVVAEWAPSFAGSLFGIEFGLERFGVTFVQNAITGSEIRGTLRLPFFDEPVEVEIRFNTDGTLAVGLSASSGLARLTKPNLLDLELDTIAFQLQDGLFTTKLSGQLTPLFGGLDWPTFDVKELSIDSKGNVRLDGGWLDVREQRTLDFHGFKLEITKLGFGKTEDGGKWIGFSGGLKLVEGLPAGASVEGLRITWYEDTRPTRITLNGIGVELTIPNVLSFKGSVSFRELPGKTPGELIRRFDGDIHLKLVTPELSIDGTLVIGTSKGPQGKYTFLAIYLDADLPTGIPLAGTGLAIYGMAGLFALQMEPDKQPAEQWFSIDHSKSWYHRGKPGVTDIVNKWEPRKGSFAVGAGLTLATLPDSGYSFSGKFLLAIVFPGPIVMLQGSAQFLKKRAEGKDEGQFRALAVLDGRAGSVLIGLDAEYRTGKKGEMIEIGGSVEAFYSFHDPSAWHLYLGQDEPRSLRIRALLGRFAEANAYFMLDAHQLALGAWLGYANQWKFAKNGPLSVTLEAWAEGSALVSFKPAHFRGELCLHGAVALKVFKFGFGLTVDACIETDLFRPFHLRGEFRVAIDLPWPFKDIGASVVLEWGPRKVAPPLPLPVSMVAVEHLKSSVVWPLPRGRNWDDGKGFLTAPSGFVQPDLATVPRVPLDARISVTFGRSVHDAAKVGVNLQVVVPDTEEIGRPGKAVVSVRYVLERLELHRQDDNGVWQLAAASPKPADAPALFGSWAPVPQLPDAGADPPQPGQTKLLLGSKTPFDFTSRTGSSWDEWVSDAWPQYPCFPELPAEETCFGFAALAPGTRVESPWTHPGPPAVTLSWGFGPATVETRTERERTVNVLCFPERAVRGGVRIRTSEPGRSFRVVLAPEVVLSVRADREAVPKELETVDEAVRCVDLGERSLGTVGNPWSDGGVRFTVLGEDGRRLPVARLERWGKLGAVGLNAGFRLDVELPCASPWVELLVTHRPPFRVVAFDAAGVAVAIHAPDGTGGPATETIRLEGPEITRLEVWAAGNEKLVHRLCYACPRPSGPSATGHGPGDVVYGPFFPVDGEIVVTGPEIPEVVVTGDGPLCLEQICVTPDPEAGQAVRRDEAIEHVREQLALWHNEGTVLRPHSVYRLTVRTRVEPSPVLTGFPADRSPVEFAYFRTDGPPGLAQLDPPEGVDTGKPFDTGLDDLVRYVRETDPPTVPLPGEKPILFRPFYRAYDVGVELNEDYVDQMYRMEGRDLGLYLYDNSNQPVRDARGRLLALTNRWGQAEAVTLSEAEVRWITQVDLATCLEEKLDPQTFPRDVTLATTEERVLVPDTLHEARLVPMLLHETFADAKPGDKPAGWVAVDDGSGGPSLWRVMEEGDPPSRLVEQASAIGGAAHPARPGTVLLLGDAAAQSWTDYRLSVWVRAVAGGAVGVTFRHQGPGRWYRFSLDERVRRLAKAGPGGLTVLAEDHFAQPRNRDVLLTVEAVGQSLRAYVDGVPAFAVDDAEPDALAAGRIGLYACESPGARFSDPRLDDFREGAPVVYRFQLVTSLHANFFHHLHSFQDETWEGTLTDAAPLAEAVASTFTPPSEAEARAYEALAVQALGPASLQRPARVEMTRLERPSGGPVLLLRSPEPLVWERLELALSRPARGLPRPTVPGELKLTEVTFGAVRPADESVTLLLREGMELTRHRVELRELPGPVAEPLGDPVLQLEGFGDAGALARFEIVDRGPAGGPSDWRVEGESLVQLAAIGGGNEPDLPGTDAILRGELPADVRLIADLRSDAGGSLGVVFRWLDERSWHRLSADANVGFRRLVKSEEGAVSILWEDTGRYPPGESFRLEIEAAGGRLTGFLGGARLFEIADPSPTAGRAGIYVAGDATARCERLEARRPSLDALALLRDRFATEDAAPWTLISEVPGPVDAAASLEVTDGELRLRSLAAAADDPAFPGAYALAGDPAWTDVILRVRLRSSKGALGVVVHAQDPGSWYRFALSRDPGFRQLVKKSGGKLTELWRDAEAYEPDRPYELTVAAVGGTLRVYVDGVLVAAVDDGELSSGRIGLYAWNNPEARFSEVRAWPAEQAFSRWELDEPFDVLLPERWSFLDQAGAPEPEPWKVDGGGLGWTAPWEGLGKGLSATAYAVAVDGDAVFAGGAFTSAGGVPVRRIAVWQGGAWSALGEGLDGPVRALAVKGQRVYVGGRFSTAGGLPARNVAVWNRASKTWSALGAGVDGPVRALAVRGKWVYAGGRFSEAGGGPASNVARWDTSTAAWQSLGAGVNGDVLALAVHEGHLHAGGSFTTAGDQPAGRVARWNGQKWLSLADTTVNGQVRALASVAGELYAGGAFTKAGGVAASRIACWTGGAWSSLGSGVDGAVESLAADGGRLWASGRFTQAGGAPASRIARWNPVSGSWASMGEGLGGTVFGVAAGADRVWAAGAFAVSASVPTSRIALLSPGRTRFALAAGPETGEARLTVRLTLGGDGAAAVLLAWQGADAHLALWLDAEQGVRRLVRSSGGSEEVLWQDTARPAADRELAVTVDVMGGRLAGYVDGVELFDLDAAVAGGQVGVAVRSPGVRVRELRWALPEWTCWHGFGEQPWLPAGTRVRVGAGAPAAEPPAEAGLVHRTAAAAGESGRLRLSPRRGALLRLALPGGAAGHARTFLPETSYTAITFDVIRKADATGLFLIPHGGPEIGSGPIRPELTWHRDRPEAGRPFSQAGDRSPERVILDVPGRS